MLKCKSLSSYILLGEFIVPSHGKFQYINLQPCKPFFAYFELALSCGVASIFQHFCEATSRELVEDLMIQKHEQWMAKYGRHYKDAKETDVPI